jgi:hypothetical protein
MDMRMDIIMDTDKLSVWTQKQMRTPGLYMDMDIPMGKIQPVKKQEVSLTLHQVFWHTLNLSQPELMAQSVSLCGPSENRDFKIYSAYDTVL